MQFTFDDRQPYELPPLPPVRKLCADAVVWLGLIVLSVWGVGKVFSDRFLLTQFASWLPSMAVAAFATACVIAHWLLTRKHAWPLGRSRVLLMRGLLALALMHAAWELRPHRLLLPVSGTQPRSNTLRVLQWNVSQTKNLDIASTLAAHDADLVLLANAPFIPSAGQVRGQLGAIPGATPYQLAQGGRLTAYSRDAILRWAYTQLRIEGSPPRAFSWPGGGMVSIDQGEALILELDTTRRLGHTTVVWLVDMPSHPGISRSDMMAKARTRLLMQDMPVVSLVDASPFVTPNPPAGSDAATIRARLARPVMVIGDMNTPRESYSLTLLAPGMRDAFGQAGRGWDRTFPGAFPLLAINNALLLPTHRCVKYHVIPMGMTRHRAQLLEVESR